ncbi:cold-shock protein [Marinomonas ostreistagni]|uniref:Cold shock domain-containing protein n=1 Tax=Marinomonas ostreistagni TaxID=359209 RepID=A0ABS0ZCG7_9GAMM|nr:cold shock domain-containing protein [Marinomonas ostreistagni]MBJ7550898.1 cold shock domain-containing protein [Marinomonas ostreistagni]
MTERFFGKVRWFNDTKGVGFIKRDDQPDVFVHYKAIMSEGHKTLKKGQSVSFSITETDFGTQAADVILEKRPTADI